MSGAKWGIVRMPHAVTGPNETNLNQQNYPMFNPTIIGELGSWGKGVPFVTAQEQGGRLPFGIFPPVPEFPWASFRR